MKNWWNSFISLFSTQDAPENLSDAWIRLKELRPVRGIMIIAFLIILFVVGKQGWDAVRRVNELSESNKALVNSREAVVLTGDIINTLWVLQGSLQTYTLDLRNRAMRDSIFERVNPSGQAFPSSILKATIEQKITKLNLLKVDWEIEHLDNFAKLVRTHASVIDSVGFLTGQANNLLERLSDEPEAEEFNGIPREEMELTLARRINQIADLNLELSRQLIEINSAYFSLKVDWETEINSATEINESLANKMTTQAVLVSLLLLMLFLMILVVIVNDINRNRDLQTKLRSEKENAQTLAEVKQRFLANMSHEIRNPLHAIIGFAEQLGQTELARNQRHLLRPLERSARYLLALINDVLDFSKIDSNNLQLETAGFSLHDVYEEVDSTFRSAAQKKGIELHTSYQEDLPEVVLGDSLRLKQMLLNLVGNAIKFTEKGSVTFAVTGKKKSGNRIQVSFEVSDTGIGIPKETQQQIFSEWTQADTGTSRHFGGTGLGLAITTKLAELHKGDLDLKSEMGEGTTFTLTIPYALGTTQDLEHTQVMDGSDEISWKGKKILVADDEPFNRVLIEILLQKMEIEADLVENGAEAINMLKEKSYDLVLLDLQMPEKDGFEVARETRAGISTELPLIAVTATATKNEADLAREAGMNELLLKPFEEKDLHRVLNKYFATTEAANS